MHHPHDNKHAAYNGHPGSARMQRWPQLLIADIEAVVVGCHYRARAKRKIHNREGGASVKSSKHVLHEVISARGKKMLIALPALLRERRRDT